MRGGASTAGCRARRRPTGVPACGSSSLPSSPQELQKQLANRVGQCVLTSPTSACFSGVPRSLKLLASARHLRYFGDGYQRSKRLGDRRYLAHSGDGWRVPVREPVRAMSMTAVGGGNLCSWLRPRAKPRSPPRRQQQGPRSAVPDAILPFPGGIVRSGSKIGSRNTSPSSPRRTIPIARRFKACRGLGALPPERPRRCSKSSSTASPPRRWRRQPARRSPPRPRAARIPASCGSPPGNFGGKLGRHHFQLRDLVP